jgi:hypothetical protein
MADTEKLLRLKILQERLVRAEEQTAEAKLQRLQRTAALREQEAEYEFNQVRRNQVMEEFEKESEWEKERRRPFMFLFTDVYFDESEEKWACQHAGVIAYGDTPSMACDNFDHLWVFGE